MKSIRKLEWLAGFTLAGIGAVAQPAQQDAAQNPPRDLTQASLEDLMKVQVTSVSKKEEKLWTAGAAVFVLTQEDIRRSGYTTIPDLLRMVPGVNVARVNANTWAISVRGFNDLYANRVLVLVDGRSVLDPIYSGVNWDDVDVPLEDIERIEVIRGPGGTVWGANAVNGVINIITRNSRDTQGGLVKTAAGNDTSSNALAQYGGEIGGSATYRVFEKYFNIDNFKTPSGGGSMDGWHSFHEGFRVDWQPSTSDTVMFEGDFKSTEQGTLVDTIISTALPTQATIDDINPNMGGNLLAQWNHTLMSGDQLSFQAYANYMDRHQIGGHDFEKTIDFTFQDHMTLGARHDLVWGTEMRFDSLETQGGYAYWFWKPNRADFFESVFVQDQIRLTNSLSLTAGSKFEHNGYTGFEAEPSAQLVWTPTARQTVWASAARAVRQPSMVDTQVRGDLAILPAYGFPFALMALQGNTNPLVESALDYELGYRVQSGKRLSIDAAAFVTLTRGARTGEALSPYVATAPAFSYLVLPVMFFYDKNIKSQGGEIFATWDATSKWRLVPSYSLFNQRITNLDAQDLVLQVGESGQSSPRHRVALRSMLSLPHNFEWDTTFAYTSSLMGGAIPAYAQLDSRFGWRYKNLEFSLNGQNLLRPSHLEFPNESGTEDTLVPRSVFAQITWRFATRPAGR